MIGKCDACLLTILLALLLDSFHLISAAALAIPEPRPISLINDPPLSLVAESVDVIANDKGRPAVRSDLLLNGDHNRIGYEEPPLSGDSGISAISAKVADGNGGQDTVVDDGGNVLSQTGSEERQSVSSSEDDKKVDQVNASTPPVRWARRTTSSTDNDVTGTEPLKEAARNNNGSGNSSSNNEDDDASGNTDSSIDELSTEAATEATSSSSTTKDAQSLVEEVEEEIVAAGGECILGSSDVYLAWWINNDGSLRKNKPEEVESDTVEGDGSGAEVSNFVDLSGVGRSEGTLFYKLLQRLADKMTGPKEIPIKFLSLARNNLARAPYSTLNLIGHTLEYLSLAGNNFGVLNASIIKDDLDWATFPRLMRLKELDLRSCKIASIHQDAFHDMQTLQKMYLSDNNLISLSAQIFSNVPNLVHLDLSYNRIEYTMTNFFTNPFEWFTRGLEINEFAFAELINLKFLDFSHTRLEPSSMKSFAYLPSRLEQLSLCYTAITVIGLGMFHTLPNLKVLDLSGNSGLTGNMNQNTFDGLQNSLEILAFENSSVKHLDWLGHLKSLKMLKLNDNNINQLTRDTFERLPSLDVLDLSYNHVGNWFSRVFGANQDLRIVNLRSNNINMITSEMLADFAQLEYLGLANNDFICNCMLRDLIDQALQNANPSSGHGFAEEIPNISELLITQVLANYLANIGLEQRETATAAIDRGANSYDSYVRVLRSYVTRGLESYQKIRTIAIQLVNADTITQREVENGLNKTLTKKRQPRKHYVLYSEKHKPKKLERGRRSLDGTEEEEHQAAFDDSSSTSSLQEMDFNFQLLDFEEDYYTCFNATTNEEYFFTELESCLLERVAAWQHLVSQLRPHQRRISVALYVIFVVMLIVCIGYYKWWYIRYFCILIKNATILSFLNKDSAGDTEGSRKSFGEISRADVYLYDVFVSYCDENREWVINELLPNLEQRNEISICLHERDFLVGLSILENIIACMDRSKCLLLVVSQSFLLSQWCQFEMHLAQHRLLETCRERLVLILLEDIPKRKRPKTLGYLMKTKTYIKWPLARDSSEASHSLQDERKIFWKRLRRSLIETDWESDR